MKRLLVSLAVIGSLAAIPVSNVLWGKAHVPTHKEQVCHRGLVRTVGAPAVNGHLGHGDCFINKRTSGFMTGATCVATDCSKFPPG